MINMPAGLVSSEGYFLGLQMAALLLPLNMVIPLCTCNSGGFPSSYKDTSHIGLGPHPNSLILT